MMKYIASGIAFVAGAAIGGIVSYFATKRVCERNAAISLQNFAGFKAEEEKKSEKESEKESEKDSIFPEQSDESSVEEEPVVFTKSDKDQMFKLVEQGGYQNGDYYSYSDSEGDGDIDREDNIAGFPNDIKWGSEPFEVTEEVFNHPPEGYHTVTGILYEGDGVCVIDGMMCTDLDEIVETLGNGVLNNTSGVYYVQNDEAERVYAIEYDDRASYEDPTFVR